MIGAVDLFEIGKYIESPLKQKFFPNKGDTDQKLLGAEVKFNVDTFTARKKVKAIRETSRVSPRSADTQVYTLPDILLLLVLPSQRREGQFLCTPPERRTGSTPSSASYADAACPTGCLLALQ